MNRPSLFWIVSSWVALVVLVGVTVWLGLKVVQAPMPVRVLLVVLYPVFMWAGYKHFNNTQYGHYVLARLRVVKPRPVQTISEGGYAELSAEAWAKNHHSTPATAFRNATGAGRKFDPEHPDER